MTNRCLVLVVFFVVATFSIPAISSTAPPAEGGMLPDISLSVPQEAIYRAYLGLQAEETFKIPEIKAEVVIIELYSMYCPHCQREAPTINQLYAQIEGNPKLRDKVKIIGIGVGNSAYEVKHFRKTYEVPFPLFADGDFKLHKQFGEVRTPYFIGIRIKKDGRHVVFYSRLGGPQDAGVMLEELIQRSGLTQ